MNIFLLQFYPGFAECAGHLFNAMSCLNILVSTAGDFGLDAWFCVLERPRGFSFADIKKSLKRQLGDTVLWLFKKQPPVVRGPRRDIHFLLIASLKKHGLGCSS